VVFGLKAHMGVNARHKLTHSIVVTSRALADGKVLPQLLHGKETAVWRDKTADEIVPSVERFWLRTTSVVSYKFIELIRRC